VSISEEKLREIELRHLGRPGAAAPTIAAIETVYHGHRFRSRLEARWAVFFDRLLVRWEYESQGYELGDLGRYLPDFWLPDLNLFLEVKGQEPTASELAKCERLRDVSSVGVAIFAGKPATNTGKLYCWDLADSSGGAGDWRVVLNDGNPLSFFVLDRCGERTLFANQWEHEIPAVFAGRGRSSRIQGSIAGDFAAGARFEHGERGR